MSEKRKINKIRDRVGYYIFLPGSGRVALYDSAQALHAIAYMQALRYREVMIVYYGNPERTKPGKGKVVGHVYPPGFTGIRSKLLFLNKAKQPKGGK